ncbi:MAG: MSEP-CTERM sorting domain-containing protein [Planctomycetota bacterium]|nr:MAG: MSEP-CTERM sorting domain-containing protein [Planctomycetota bacterium]
MYDSDFALIEKRPIVKKIFSLKIQISPFIFLISYLIPQIMLLAINFHVYFLIEDVLENTFEWLFCYQAIMLLANLFILFHLIKNQKEVPFILIIISLILHFIYLIYVVSSFDSLIPSSIQQWIINDFEFMSYQFFFISPGFFACIVYLSCVKSKMSQLKEFFFSFFLVVCLPVSIYFVFVVIDPFFRLIDFSFSQFIFTSFFMVVTVIFIGGFIRLFSLFLFSTHNSDLKNNTVLLIIYLLTAGGLLLNNTIPIPTKFDSTWFYILEALNGVVLFWPWKGRNSILFSYFGKIVMFPFVLYFFLVFLPFLPVSIFAIIALGGGFLMLSPIALFLLQGRIIINNFDEVSLLIGKSKTITFICIALLLLPAFFGLKAWRDRVIINQTMEYIYSPNYNDLSVPKLNIQTSAKILINLKMMKQGNQYPLISKMYNQIVFNGMVLPNKKIDELYSTLTGDKIIDEYSMGYDRRNWNRNGISFVKPSENVNLNSLVQHSELLGNVRKTTIHLTMKNEIYETHVLYKKRFHLPQGIFVTKLQLKINGEFVDARVFDRKTALWVFEKITEVRRDPAIITYVSPNKLELSVYPFPKYGIREVKIEFSSHQDRSEEITLDGQTFFIGDSRNKTKRNLICGNNLVLSNFKLLPSIKRKPYLHFVLDYSTGNQSQLNVYARNILQVSKELNIFNCKITACNLLQEGSNQKLISIKNKNQIKKILDKFSLPFEGGFWFDNFLKREVLKISSLTESSYHLKYYPVFIVLSSKKPIVQNFQYYENLLPEFDGFFYQPKNGKLHLPENSYSTSAVLKLKDVVLLKSGFEIKVSKAMQPRILTFNQPIENLTVFHSNSGKFVSANNNVNIAEDTLWSQSIKLWSKSISVKKNPALVEKTWRSLLLASRDQHILMPNTAMIVVESSSQWKMLEKKEKQRLSSKNGMEFDEMSSSEPYWWILPLILITLIYLKKLLKFIVVGQN